MEREFFSIGETLRVGIATNFTYLMAYGYLAMGRPGEGSRGSTSS